MPRRLGRAARWIDELAEFFGRYVVAEDFMESLARDLIEGVAQVFGDPDDAILGGYLLDGIRQGRPSATAAPTEREGINDGLQERN